MLIQLKKGLKCSLHDIKSMAEQLAKMFRILLLSKGVFTVNEKVSGLYFFNCFSSSYPPPPPTTHTTEEDGRDKERRVRIMHLWRTLGSMLNSHSGPTTCYCYSLSFLLNHMLEGSSVCFVYD